MAREHGFWKRKRRGSSVWYTRHPSTKRTVSTGCRDLVAAKLYRARLERYATDPAHAATDSSACGLSYVMRKMIENRRRAGRSAATSEIYRCKGGHLIRCLGSDVDVNQLRCADLEAYVDKREKEEGAHRHTIKKELITLRVALKVAREDGAYRGSFELLFPEFSADYQPRTRALSKLEFDSLLGALPPGRRQAVALMGLTGARLGECARLTWNDVGAEHVFLRGTKTKDATREVALLPVLRQLLAELPRGSGDDRVFPSWNNLYRDLRAACSRIGIAPCTPTTCADRSLPGCATPAWTRPPWLHSSAMRTRRCWRRCTDASTSTQSGSRCSRSRTSVVAR